MLNSVPEEEKEESTATRKLRKSFRCPVAKPAPLKVRLRSASDNWTGEAVNISPNGMLVEFDKPRQPLRVGDHVKLALQASTGPTRLLAAVRHCTRKQCGLQFVNPLNDDAFEPPEPLQHTVSNVQRQYLQARRRNY